MASLLEIGFRVVMGEELRLTFSGLREPLHQGLRNLAMGLLALAFQLRLIGGILDQRVSEAVRRVGRNALH